MPAAAARSQAPLAGSQTGGRAKNRCEREHEDVTLPELRSALAAATMGVAAPLRALLLVGAAAGAEDAEQRLDEAACRALGFGPSLLCSSCDRLGEFVGADDALVGECRSCCTADSSSSSVYASATLDVCR